MILFVLKAMEDGFTSRDLASSARRYEQSRYARAVGDQ